MQDRPRKPNQRMVRKQFLITADQNRRLKAAAAASGMTEANLVRAGIERQLAESAKDDNWKERLLKLAGSLSPKEASHMEATIKEIRERSGRRIDAIRKRMAGEE